MSISRQSSLPTQLSPKLLCLLCNSFYGTKATSSLCSQCYKQSQTIKIQTPKRQSKRTAIPQSAQLIKQDLARQQARKAVDRQRCGICNRKVRLLGVQCRCGIMYCNMHRLPEIHKCRYDYREEGKEQLYKEVVKVEKGKVEAI